MNIQIAVLQLEPIKHLRQSFNAKVVNGLKLLKRFS